MTVLKALRTAGLALVLGLAAQNPAQAATPTADSPPNSEFARDFSLLVPPVPAPLEVFTDLGGARVRLADFEGQVLLVNFWATWCAPCVREMPTLDRLQADLAGEDFEVIALSQDFDGLMSVPPFYQDHGLSNLEVYIDTRGKIADALGVVVLPTTLLIDRDGRIVGGLEGPAEWDTPAVKALIRHYLDSMTSAGAG
jgi:thiol-disulfide isomerase/thioredoxin